MSSFLENFAEVLLSPEKTFEKLKENPPLLQGFVIVILASIINPLVKFEITNPLLSLIGLVFNLIGSAFWGIIAWLFWASFIEMIASVFKQPGKIKEFLTLSAFALIPWIFIAPLELLKAGGLLGSFFGVILLLIVWLWVTILQILALMKTYNLSFGRVLVLIAIPFFGGFIAINWFIGFFATLFDILK